VFLAASNELCLQRWTGTAWSTIQKWKPAGGAEFLENVNFAGGLQKAGVNVPSVNEVPSIEEMERNFYNDYDRDCRLYYAGVAGFDGPSADGLVGMTYETFANITKIDGASTAAIDTTNKRALCPKPSVNDLLNVNDWTYYESVNSTYFNGSWGSGDYYLSLDGSVGASGYHQWSKTFSINHNQRTTLTWLWSGSGTTNTSFSCLIKVNGGGEVSLYSRASGNFSNESITRDISSYLLPGNNSVEVIIRQSTSVGSQTNQLIFHELEFKGVYQTATVIAVGASATWSIAKARCFYSAKVPAGCSVSVEMQSGGVYEVPTQIYTRTDPLDATLSEYWLERVFVTTGMLYVVKFTLTPDGVNDLTPELKRFGNRF
jgi:hypothetical protein